MDAGLWVFGYGSLVWNPGFEYIRSLVGSIRGYDRRFWQGNATHRGTPEKPGRVATLVENKEGVTWGRAFLLSTESASNSLAYLNQRESGLGGYVTTIVMFKPQDPKEGPNHGEHFPVLLYIATEHNPLYLGPGPLSKVADQIGTTSGTCGSNIEYVVKLAQFMREYLPFVWDDHLFEIESHLKQKYLSTTSSSSVSPEVSSSGNDSDCVGGCYSSGDEAETYGLTSSSRKGTSVKTKNITTVETSSDEKELSGSESGSNDDFSSRVKSRKLKCVSII